MIRPCCQDPANLAQVPHTVPRETLQQCRICGAKHYEFDAPPVHFGIRGNAAGPEHADPVVLPDAEWQLLVEAEQALASAIRARQHLVLALLGKRGLTPRSSIRFVPEGV